MPIILSCLGFPNSSQKKVKIECLHSRKYPYKGATPLYLNMLYSLMRLHLITYCKCIE